MNYIHITEVCIVLVFIIFSLYRNWLGASFTFLIAVVFLAVCGVITPKEVLEGASNEQVMVVVMLLLLGNIIRQVGLIENIFSRMFYRTKNKRLFSFQMMAMVGSFSAFFNNTPLVAVMMPYVNSWCKQNNTTPSKLLIPLSYAAILGGALTLVGTSTNLIVDSMLVKQTGKSLAMFDFTAVGLPMLVIGVAYLLIFGEKLLPVHNPVFDQITNNREYIVESIIPENSNFIGKKLEEVGFIDIKGLFLFAVYRNDYKVTIEKDLIFQKDDTLLFTGDTEMITEILIQKKDLVLPEAGKLTYPPSSMIEVVVSHNSNLISKTSKEVNFRAKYNAALIAIHRNGSSLKNKLSTQKIKAGDVLLLISDEYFKTRILNNHNLYIISKTSDIKKCLPHVTWLLIIGIFTSIVLSAINLVPLFTSLLVVIAAVLLFNISSPKDIVGKIDFNLALTIILALALGTAMIKTGVAGIIADSIITSLKPFGIVGLLFALYITTSFLGAYITNKASIAISFPIGLAMAEQIGIEPKPFILLIAFAATANFMTPIGYQTNLMVYGPGSYTFKDFLKIGFPLTVIYMIVCVGIIYFLYIK